MANLSLLLSISFFLIPFKVLILLTFQKRVMYSCCIVDITTLNLQPNSTLQPGQVLDGIPLELSCHCRPCLICELWWLINQINITNAAGTVCCTVVYPRIVQCSEQLYSVVVFSVVKFSIVCCNLQGCMAVQCSAVQCGAVQCGAE